MSSRPAEFQSISSEGGLLPPDLLRRILDPKEKLEGTTPTDYSLPPGERFNEVITQSWNRLRKHWADFRAAANSLPDEEAGTGLTNDKWSIPLLRELGFGLVPTTPAPQVGGKTYAINRFFGPTPIHLLGCHVSLDRRAKGVRGAASANPHGLVQDFLNRSPQHLWGILSNGLKLRVLRDSQAISRQSYLEVDLESMFEGEVFADFALLWMVAHATRFMPQQEGHPETCWLECWTQVAEEQGVSALQALGKQVEQALQILGQGFVEHPRNTALRDALRTGQITRTDFHGQLLRVVYRLIFLFVAEDRRLEGIPLLHPPDDSATASIARQRYSTHYSASRLRELAGQIRGTRHGDLWWQFNVIVGAVSGDERFAAARESLALPALGSYLWSPDSTAALNAPLLAAGGGTELANIDFLHAIEKLAYTEQTRIRRPVAYKSLGAEELGGVYESLLELTPQISGDGATFTFEEFGGSERKTSGSYYTPDPLVQNLLDSALEPVIQAAIKNKNATEAQRALLSLTVCDPAVGSGHFLVGAARRLAQHLARLRAAAEGEGEPSPTLYQHALRDVIGACLYGVDMNPMAAELCRVALWLEALDPGKPLSFLDHHIRVGNSLLGTTPHLIAQGLPDETFIAMEGDDKKVCQQLKKRNKAEREGFSQVDWLLGGARRVDADLQAVTEEVRNLNSMADDSLDARLRKEARFHRLQVSPEYQHAQRVSDAWCAAFVYHPKTMATLANVLTTTSINELMMSSGPVQSERCALIEELSNQYRFFHWHLAFPEVFEQGGFDCVLGNPPWDMQEVKDNEFFAASYPAILSVRSAKDKAEVLEQIRAEAPDLWQQYEQYVRLTYGQRHLMAHSGRFPLASVGRLNLYRMFLEIAHTLVNRAGRAGLVVPSGFASDSFSQDHFASLHGAGRLISLFDFENREGIFPAVHASYRFALLTIGPERSCEATDFVFFAHLLSDLMQPHRHIRLSQESVTALNPLTRTAPLFRSMTDYVLTLRLQKSGPLIGSTHGGWAIAPTLMFMMNAELQGHRTADELEREGFRLVGNRYTHDRETWLPFYEGKMVGLYDHRAASIRFDPTNRVRRNQPVALTVAEHQNVERLAIPMFWLSEADVAERCGATPRWCLAIKDVTSATNERTAIAALLPGVALTDSLPWLRTPQPAGLVACLLANLNSYVFDYVARQKVAGMHLRGHYLAQLPILDVPVYGRPCPWDTTQENLQAWLTPRILELTYTACDLQLFADDCGYRDSPFIWDEERRFLLQAELNAAFFHLYLPADPDGGWLPVELDSPEHSRLCELFPTPRHAVDYVMETFPLVKGTDESQYGSYRTKEAILTRYDEMLESIRTGRKYPLNR